MHLKPLGRASKGDEQRPTDTSRESPLNVAAAGPQTPEVAVTVQASPAAALTAGLWEASFGWLVMTVLLLIQWGLFYQFAQREVVGWYPRNFDQTVDLLQSYETYEQILTKGLIAGVVGEILKPTARGFLTHLQASILYLLLGPTRMTALTENFAYFALLQCALVGTLRWLTDRWAPALLGLGLLLTASTPFLWAGGFMDFRLDFTAFCLFGILICAVIRSRVFASWRWSLVVGAVAATLVLSRFICMVYLGGIFGLFFLSLVANMFMRRHVTSIRTAVLSQIWGVLVAGASLLVITLPALWCNRYAIREYYLIGHLVSPEKEIRAREFGVFSALDSLLFYAKSALRDHVGPLFLAVCAIVVAVVATLALLRWRRERTGQLRNLPNLWSPFLFVSYCFIVPYVALTSDVSKSPVVGNILVPSLLWFVMLVALSLTGVMGTSVSNRLEAFALGALATLAICAGLYQQFERLGRRTVTDQQRVDLEQIMQLHDSVFDYYQRVGWQHPRISVDHIADYFRAEVWGVVTYERHGVLVGARGALGHRILDVSEPEAINQLRETDVAVLSIPPGPEPHIYPFDLAMENLRPKIVAFCDQTLLLIRRFHIGGHDVRLYIRPSLRLTADGDGWVTRKGLLLSGPSDFLRQRPRVEIRGKSNLTYLGGMPAVHAELDLPNREPVDVPAAMTATGEDYRIVLDFDEQVIPNEPDVNIRVWFDRYFVPKELGMNDDTRELVIRTPDLVKLLPRA